MVLIQGPWKATEPPPEPSPNHPAGRRRGKRFYCLDCSRMFDPMRVVPDDRLCSDCRDARPAPDPTLFDTP